MKILRKLKSAGTIYAEQTNAGKRLIFPKLKRLSKAEMLSLSALAVGAFLSIEENGYQKEDKKMKKDEYLNICRTAVGEYINIYSTAGTIDIIVIVNEPETTLTPETVGKVEDIVRELLDRDYLDNREQALSKIREKLDSEVFEFGCQVFGKDKDGQYLYAQY